MEAAGWGGVLLTTYTKFTFSEFRVCVRAIFAFGAGYKLGERYELGELERRRGQSAAVHLITQSVCMTLVYRATYSSSEIPSTASSRLLSELVRRLSGEADRPQSAGSVPLIDRPA